MRTLLANSRVLKSTCPPFHTVCTHPPTPTFSAQEWWRIWDFFSHHPESCHMFTFLLDDVGIPANYRTMEGFGVHAFKLINKAGTETLAKFHWLPKQGVKNLLDDEAAAVGGRNH